MLSFEPLRAALQTYLPAGLSAHAFFELLGVSVAVTSFVLECRRRRRLEDDLVAVLLGALIGGAVASRLATLPLYLAMAAEPTLLGAFLESGQSVLGGLAGAYLGAVVTKRLVGYREGTGDLFVAGVALGIAVGRVGCLLEEPPGTPTSLPWAVVMPAERASLFPRFPAEWAGLPLHPSFAYEIVFHLGMFVLLLRWRRREELRGELLKLYLLAYALFRFAVEFVRGNPEFFWGLSRSQWFLIPSALLLAFAVVRHSLRKGASHVR